MRGSRGEGCQRSLSPELTLKNRPGPPSPPLAIKAVPHNLLPSPGVLNPCMNKTKLKTPRINIMQFYNISGFCFDMCAVPVYYKYSRVYLHVWYIECYGMKYISTVLPHEAPIRIYS